jgi:hypothetical protein
MRCHVIGGQDVHCGGYRAGKPEGASFVQLAKATGRSASWYIRVKGAVHQRYVEAHLIIFHPASPKMTFSKTLTLNTGAKIPTVGLGTWQAAPGEVAKAVEAALKAGYRHIDCAWAYGNENEVGEGIKASGVPREEIFIVSKLWSTFHRNPEKGLQESLDKLGTDYLDLYLMHWPIPLNGENKSVSLPFLCAPIAC